jgi:hypothetical protein
MKKNLCIVIGLACILAIAVAQAKTVRSGSTKNRLYHQVMDVNGEPNLTINVADYDAYYIEEGAAISAKVDITALAAADSAWDDYKGFDVGQGWVRVDWPNAAFDGDPNSSVILILKDATGATDDGHIDVIEQKEIQLGTVADVAYLANSATGITNLANVFVTGYATAFDDVNGLLNSRSVSISKGIELMQDSDVRNAMRYQLAALIGDVNDGSLAKLAQDINDLAVAIKAVTDKVDTMLVADGAVSQLTANAQELGTAATVDANDTWEYVVPANPTRGTAAWYIRRILNLLGLE